MMQKRLTMPGLVPDFGVIAQAVRFEDPLYFSRRFRDVTGESASGYRRSHRYPVTIRKE